MNPNQQENSNRTVDASRGSTLWTQTFFKEAMLTALLNDIGRLQDTGIANHQHCLYIQRALNNYADALTEIPNVGFFAGKALYEHVERFAKIYEKWNDVNGESIEEQYKRRSLHRDLRKARQRIANKERKLRFEIDNNFDVAHLRAGYQAMQDVVELVPTTFKDLGSALKEFAKKGGQLS